MRIIHFSDIHAGGVVKSVGGLFDKRLWGMGNHVFRRMWKRHWERVERGVSIIRGLDPDVVICTGDFSTLSEPAEFSMAMDVLKPLVDDTRFEFLAIPGNHDHYVDSDACERALNGAMHFLNRDRWGLDGFPRVVEVDTVRFIMINQACPVAPWLSSGKMSAETVAFLDGELASHSDQPKILVNHFPIFDAYGAELSWRRGCVNNQSLKAALKEGSVDIALCGHIHRPFIRKEASGAIEVCAGSLSYHGAMNMIEYEPTSKDYVQSWIYVDDQNAAPETPSAATALSSS